jgi:hypothetical protein
MLPGFLRKIMAEKYEFSKSDLDLLVDSLIRVKGILEKEQYASNAALLDLLIEKFKPKE